MPLGLQTQVNEKQYVGRGDYQPAPRTPSSAHLRSQYFAAVIGDATNILSSTQGDWMTDQTWTGGDT